MQRIRKLILYTLLFGWLSVSGQKAELYLFDLRSKDPVAFAHLQITYPGDRTHQTFATDMDGKAVIELKRTALIAVSAVGYKIVYDTIHPDEKRKIGLQPEVYMIDEVVVTGQYTPQAVDKSIFRVKVIGAKTIDQKASNNLGELMAGELNIRTSFDGALGSQISLQGLGGEHVKFLIDGVPVIGRMNGNIDLGQLNLYNVK